MSTTATTSEHLVRMANDIGAFFEVMPDQHQAAKDVATHIKKFWEPRMQRSFLEYLKAHGDQELKPVVREAVREIHPS
ncbi:MAG: formate dehydrogenase subunit delta [Betaproteobacteria bacterium]|nr:formate dehydrogenase subunit delta [Betaproteobacteria bacterium]MDE2211624.1 formate dehydrogenase subunit delta [Betaproteobacteria bacterium]MDE2353617.1 formate dehydrogenase subunit delta [Betaproteobacteria bacterium]